MDNELLIALWVLWFSSTFLIVIMLRVIFMNDSEAFHPHSVELEARHGSFACVGATVCKRDCAVKHISSYVAPRGSTSAKFFLAACCCMAVAGILGTSRWRRVEASELEAVLAYIGWVCLALVGMCVKTRFHCATKQTIYLSIYFLARYLL